MRNPIVIRTWLLAVALCTLVMVAVGGITRLTDSGLSMTDWQPILGTVYPRGEAEWTVRFEQYKASPQFEQINFLMSLESFKAIFFWEWLHRVLGRGTGLVALLPWLLFAGLRWIRRPWLGRLFLVPLLVLLQGLLGWFMVKSGLVDVPRVSPLRLAAHLGLALGLFGYCLWLWLEAGPAPRPDPRPGLARFARGFILLAVVQIFFGAMVAGLDAGGITREWPTLFGGRWIPPLNSLPVTMHFVHRTFAWVVALAGAGLCLRMVLSTNSLRQRLPAVALGLLLVLQMILGVLTITRGMPLVLASLHQVNAAFLLGGGIWSAWHLRR